jgi:hypothetical protein
VSSTPIRSRPAVLAVLFGVAGAAVAVLLGLLTFGAQATVAPEDVPLAVGPADQAAATQLEPVVQRVTGQGEGRVDWRRVDSREEAERLLDDKDVYGALLFEPNPAGGLRAVVLTSGAINPGATQLAQPLLTSAGEAVTSASRAQLPGEQPGPPPGAPATGEPKPAVEVVTLHEASAAGRTLPLAASALLWITGLLAGVLVIAAAPRLRGGRPLGRLARILTTVVAAALGTGVVVGFGTLWDADLPFSWELTGFLALAGLGFALLQSGILRWLGLRGMAILAPLYLIAPSLAGQVPELLHPAYRALLWSWSPFRFTAEAIRSLLFLDSGVPDVARGVWVMGGFALAGLLLLLLPGRATTDRPAPVTEDEPATEPAPEPALTK